MEILRDRIELEYKIKSELGPMRVAYRESISESHEVELCLDKVIGGASMYAKLKIRIESTLEDYDMAEIQKRKFEGGEDVDKMFSQTQNSYSLDDDREISEFSNLAANQIFHNFETLEPVVERVKLEGNEYDTGNKR